MIAGKVHLKEIRQNWQLDNSNLEWQNNKLIGDNIDRVDRCTREERELTLSNHFKSEINPLLESERAIRDCFPKVLQIKLEYKIPNELHHSRNEKKNLLNTLQKKGTSCEPWLMPHICWSPLNTNVCWYEEGLYTAPSPFNRIQKCPSTFLNIFWKTAGSVKFSCEIFII